MVMRELCSSIKLRVVETGEFLIIRLVFNNFNGNKGARH